MITRKPMRDDKKSSLYILYNINRKKLCDVYTTSSFLNNGFFLYLTDKKYSKVKSTQHS